MNKFPLQSLGTLLNWGSTVISSRAGWIGVCKSADPLWFINQICCENFAWIRNSGKNILITPKVQNLGPKKWMNLQSAAIAESGNPLKSHFESEIWGKILSKSADPFAYSPPSSQIAYIPLVRQITVVLSSNKMLSLFHNLLTSDWCHLFLITHQIDA